MFCTWKKKVSTSLGSQTSKRFLLEIWQWICFFLITFTDNRSLQATSLKTTEASAYSVASSLEYPFLSVICPSYPTRTPYFPFLSGICTVCVWTSFFCDFWWLLPQLIWKQDCGNCWVFAQGNVGSRSLCVDPVFGSCRVGCVYGASALGRNFLS